MSGSFDRFTDFISCHFLHARLIVRFSLTRGSNVFVCIVPCEILIGKLSSVIGMFQMSRFSCADSGRISLDSKERALSHVDS